MAFVHTVGGCDGSMTHSHTRAAMPPAAEKGVRGWCVSEARFPPLVPWCAQRLPSLGACSRTAIAMTQFPKNTTSSGPKGRGFESRHFDQQNDRFLVKSGRFLLRFVHVGMPCRMGQWPIWLQIVHLARQMAIFLCSENPQTLDFQGLAGFLRWQSGRQIRACF